MNHDSMIAVIEAHKKDWRSVEFRRQNSNNEWATPAMNTHFDFFDFEYRVIPPKPKMVKYFGYIDPDGFIRLLRSAQGISCKPSNMSAPFIRAPSFDCELPE